MSLGPIAEMSISVLWNATSTRVPQALPFPAATILQETSLPDFEYEVDFANRAGNSSDDYHGAVNGGHPMVNTTGRRRQLTSPMSGINFMLKINSIRYYGDPIIFVVGFIGNIIAYLVFTRSRFRKVPSVPYLAGIAVADSGYLLTYYLTTLTMVNYLPIMNQVGVCQFGTFANFAFLFLSSWYGVALVTERFIAVFWPLKKVSMCTTFKNKVVLVCFAVLAVVAYSYVIYFFGPTGNICKPWDEFNVPFSILMILDCVVVFVLPVLVVTVLVLLIAIRGCEYYRISSTAADLGPRGRSGRGRGGPVSSSSSAHALQISELFYALVALLILTHLPNSICRVMVYFQSNEIFVVVSMVVRQIHLGSFGLKFFLYFLVSRTFRKHALTLLRRSRDRLHRLFCCWCCRSTNPKDGACPVPGARAPPYCCLWSSEGSDVDSEAQDPQRISLKGCGPVHQAAKDCLIQSDV